ncbi:MAG: DUF4430 domain-containing protein [Ruminococcaceae bacterium]|nr:DUF4430 domain-containing protein [Oscillospiraceae bacterium]
MKKTLNSTLSLIISIILVVCLVSCNQAQNADLWENAAYTSDAAFGNGVKTVEVEVTAGEKSVTFTINTDKETLGEALIEHGLVSGEEGPYGLYIKAVNGITADYDVDQSYWSFTKDGEYMMSGVDSETISGGEHYELTYTK